MVQGNRSGVDVGDVSRIDYDQPSLVGHVTPERTSHVTAPIPTHGKSSKTKCLSLMHEHLVVPGSSWGSLTIPQQQ
jgi:hypothetical protein